VRSMSLRRSSVTSPNLKAHQADSCTSSRIWSGIALVIVSSSSRVAGRISRARLTFDAPRIRQGFTAISSSSTADDRIDLSRA